MSKNARAESYTEGGQAMITAVLFFVFITVALVAALMTPALSHLRVSAVLFNSMEAFTAAEAGLEDVVYRMKTGKEVSDQTIHEIGSATVTIDRENLGNEIAFLSEAVVAGEFIRRVDARLMFGILFQYGVQAGNGGIILENSARVEGDVYSIGEVRGTSSGNTIEGSVISAGPDGYIYRILSEGSLTAYHVERSSSDENIYAYHVEDSDATSGYACYEQLTSPVNTAETCPENPYEFEIPPLEDLPISDQDVESMKEAAEAGGVIECSDTYVIDSDETIGPVHITCDLEVTGGGTVVTLGGHVWVEGSIRSGTSGIYQIDDALGHESVAIIADDPADRLTGSTIEFINSPEFRGAGDSEFSYVLALSQNESVSEGGSVPAITVENSLSGAVLVYAGNGEIQLRNYVELTEVTAYQVRGRNQAKVIYEEGLSRAFFDSGPQGDFSIRIWKEVE